MERGEGHDGGRASGGTRADGGPLFSVVVVSHNNVREIGRCLDGCARASEVVLVDSGSTDSTVALVRERYPEIRVVELAENLGYGAAANRGVEELTTPYVVVMNADAWPLDGALEELTRFAERNAGVGLAGPGLVYPDGSPQRSVFAYPRGAASFAAWVAFPNLVSRVYRVFRQGDRDASAEPANAGRTRIVVEPEFVSGAGLLVRRTAFDGVGGFDERFFLYSEETDLCRRMRHAGWDVAYVPEATFVHIGGASAASAPASMYGQQLLSHLCFLVKHRDLRVAEAARRLLVVVLTLRAYVGSRDRARRLRAAARLLRTPETRAALESFE